MREMGDIPARRADGAGADLPLPTDLPRRASLVGEAKRRLSADGRHPERNPDGTRSTAQKLQDKKVLLTSHLIFMGSEGFAVLFCCRQTFAREELGYGGGRGVVASNKAAMGKKIMW